MSTTTLFASLLSSCTKIQDLKQWRTRISCEALARAFGTSLVCAVACLLAARDKELGAGISLQEGKSEPLVLCPSDIITSTSRGRHCICRTQNTVCATKRKRTWLEISVSWQEENVLQRQRWRTCGLALETVVSMSAPQIS